MFTYKRNQKDSFCTRFQYVSDPKQFYFCGLSSQSQATLARCLGNWAWTWETVLGAPEQNATSWGCTFRTHQFDYFAWRTLIKLVVSMLPFCIWILEENGWNFIFRIHLQPASLVWAAPARCKSRCSNEALVARAGWMPLASRAMAGSLPLPNPWRRKNIQTKNWTLPGSCALWRLLGLQKNVSIKFMNLPSRGIWGLSCWGLSIFHLSFLDEKTKHCEGSLLSRQGQKTASWSGQLRRQPMFHLASSRLCWPVLYRLYHSAIINSQKSPAVDANDSVTAAPLPPSWYGMYDNHEGNGDKRSPSHSGGLKVHKVEFMKWPAWQSSWRPSRNEHGNWKWKKDEKCWSWVGILLGKASFFPVPNVPFRKSLGLWWIGKLCSSGTVKEPPNLRR